MRRAAMAPAILSVLTTALVISAPPTVFAAESDGLQPFYSAVGTVTLSLDAMGSTGATGTVQVDKPAGGTVQKAFLFTASTGSSGYLPTDDDVKLDGQSVSWNNEWTLESRIGSYNVASDVTALVSQKLNGAPSGLVELTISEAHSLSLDGEVLAVVWQSPSARSRTVALLYGALAPGGDHFEVQLSEALKPSSSATMSLGISYGHQPSGQFSNISVNNALLTSSAGGEDDGTPSNGGLITVGGVGDSSDNPEDPSVHDDCGNGPRCDDELYDLKALVGTGATSFTVDTNNPSNDDNVFLAAFDLGGEAIVGNGVLLTPGAVAHDTSTSHTVVARVQDQSGGTVSTGRVTAEVVSGPNTGVPITGIRIPDGRVVFTYSSSLAGTDAIQATFTDADGNSQVSNIVSQRWFTPVEGSIGGWAWPAPTHDVTLTYSYGGNHRYYGNVYQAAANWNATNTRLTFREWASGQDAIQVRVADAWSDGSNDLLARLFGDTYGVTMRDNGTFDPDDPFAQITILLYQRLLDQSSDAQRTKVATHELGHAIGLAHTTTMSGATKGTTPSVMWQGEVSGTVRTSPQTIDINRVNGLYP